MKPIDGVGEKITVFETTGTYDISEIMSFFESSPQDIKNKIIMLGVVSYVKGGADVNFSEQMYSKISPESRIKRFVRYE